MTPPVIRPLGRDDVAALHGLRLESLMRHPEAYGSFFAQEAQMRPEDFARIFLPAPPGAMFGAFLGPQLAGMLGLQIPTPPHRRHIGQIIAVYVQPLHRRARLGAQLLDAAIAQARTARLELLQLSVTTSAEHARRLYLSRGFHPTGLTRHAFKFGRAYYDEESMQLDLTA